MAGGIVGGNLQSAWNGATTGALSGGIYTTAGIMSQDWNAFGKMAARSVAAGTMSELQGGTFADGFRSTFGVEGLNWVGWRMRQTALSWARNNPLYKKSIGSSEGLWGDWDRTAGVFPAGKNYTGSFWETFNFGGRQFSGERYVFGIPYGRSGPVNFVAEAFGGPHDFLDGLLYNRSTGTLNSFGDGFGGTVYSIATLPLAAPFAAALMVQPMEQHYWALR